MALQTVLLSGFAALVGLACGAAGARSLLRKRPEARPPCQRAAGACSASALVLVGVLGLLWCFISPPPFSVEIVEAPSFRRNDPALSVYLGNGCFWHTQYDAFLVEQDAAGPFRGRNMSQITSLVGFAGGRYQSAGGAVCYGGLPATDYSRLGHAEAVSIMLDEITGPVARSQVSALAQMYFEHGFQSLPDGRRQRLDPQDVGASYRNVIGLPGGMDNSELWPLFEEANTYGMPLLRGAVGDSEGEYVVYVYDSMQYPFFRGEAHHQFHPNNVIQRPVPLSYTSTLKSVQEEMGRLEDSDRGCPDIPFYEIVFVIVMLFSMTLSSGIVRLSSKDGLFRHLHRHSGYRGGGFSRDDIPGTTLEELLRSFSRLERIDGYKCEKCRQTGCVRSAYIKRPPNNLVFYIDRRQDSSRFGKINRAVQFPQELDATPFVEESSSGSYQLYGIVVHQDFNGSTFFGHYIAFVKDRERGLWHRVDDDQVSEVPWSVVKEQRANLLFYAAKTVSLPPCEDGISEPIPRPKSDDTDGMCKGAARRVQEEHNVPVASAPKPGLFQQDARRCANETSEDAATSPKLSGGFFDFDDLEEKETEMAQRAEQRRELLKDSVYCRSACKKGGVGTGAALATLEQQAAISACDSLFALIGWRTAAQGAVPGSRLRCRGDHQDQDELSDRWNDKSKSIEKVSSSNSAEVETIESVDPQAILQRLEEHRLSDVFEAAAQDGEPEAMLFSLQDIEEELDAFRWITAEVVARRIELEALEQENQRFREEQARLRQSYEGMMEEAELDMREDGTAS
ncbi:UBP18 [Symbiodinium sp. CCMP2592]|nr:UBP18 [Symbiodinium sp. CCMP2592]